MTQEEIFNLKAKWEEACWNLALAETKVHSYNESMGREHWELNEKEGKPWYAEVRYNYLANIDRANEEHAAARNDWERAREAYFAVKDLKPSGS